MKINLKTYQAKSAESKPPSVKPKGESLSDLMNKDIQLFGNNWKAEKKEALYNEMSVLLKAGMDLKTALDVIEENQDKKKDQKIIQNISEFIISGLSLSEALEREGKFTPYEIFSVKIAEESGKLVDVLEELATYFKKSIQYRRLLVSALSYPVLVIGVSLLTLAFMLNFLIPLFGDIYKRLNQELPAATKMVINLSEFFNDYFLYGILGIVLIGSLIFYNRKQIWLRAALSKMLLKTPLFGKIFRQIYIARFAHSMSFLLESKVPIIQALGLTEKMIGFYPIEKSAKDSAAEILKGKPFFASLQKHSVYPKRVIALLKVGEETNQLNLMLGRIASQYEEETEQKIKLLGSLIEPILIVFLAITVGFILIAMYLPIFNLVTSFGVQ